MLRGIGGGHDGGCGCRHCATECLGSVGDFDSPSVYHVYSHAIVIQFGIEFPSQLSLHSCTVCTRRPGNPFDAVWFKVTLIVRESFSMTITLKALLVLVAFSVSPILLLKYTLDSNQSASSLVLQLIKTMYCRSLRNFLGYRRSVLLLSFLLNIDILTVRYRFELCLRWPIDRPISKAIIDRQIKRHPIPQDVWTEKVQAFLGSRCKLCKGYAHGTRNYAPCMGVEVIVSRGYYCEWCVLARRTYQRYRQPEFLQILNEYQASAVAFDCVMRHFDAKDE